MTARVEINISFTTTGADKAKEALAPLEKTASASGKAADATARLERAKQQLAQSEIRVAAASRDYGKALQLNDAYLKTLTPDTVAYNNALARQATLARQAQASQTGAASATSGLGGKLLSLAGGFSAASIAAHLFNSALDGAIEGFKLAAQIDQNQRSLARFVGDQERANGIMRDANRFGREYGFTQAEIAAATREAGLILKNTTADTEKVLGVLTRLSTLNPEQGISGATFALKELASGDIQSLAERFNVSRDAARGLRDEIAAGADPVLVLDRYLSSLGITNDALSDRLQGNQGVMLRWAQASENAKLAGGNFLAAIDAPAILDAFATGVTYMSAGLTLLLEDLREAKAEIASHIPGNTALADSLFVVGTMLIDSSNASATLTDSLDTTAAATQAAQGSVDLFTVALQEEVIKSLEAERAQALLTERKYQLEYAARQVTNGVYNEAQGLTYLSYQLGITVDEAKRLLNIQLQLNDAMKEGNARKLGADIGKAASRGGAAAIRDYTAEIERANTKSQRQSATAARTAERAGVAQAKRDTREAEQEADRLAKARDELRSDREKLADREARAADPNTSAVERLELQKEILDLQKKIADEAQREAQAAIDAQLARLEDSKLRRQELKDAEQAQRILRNAGASDDQKVAARERLAEIELERQKRQLEIAEKERQAGQSTGALPAGGAAAGVIAPAGGTPVLSPVAGGGATSGGVAGAAGGQALLVQLFLDSAMIGEALFPRLEARMVASMGGALEQNKSAGVLDVQR